MFGLHLGLDRPNCLPRRRLLSFTRLPPKPPGNPGQHHRCHQARCRPLHHAPRRRHTLRSLALGQFLRGHRFLPPRLCRRACLLRLLQRRLQLGNPVLLCLAARRVRLLTGGYEIVMQFRRRRRIGRPAIQPVLRQLDVVAR